MRTKQLFSAVILTGCLVMTGCVSKGYGNYSNASMIANSSMADDTVKHLGALFPPGRTEFKLKQPAADPYGTALIQRLRSRGYAVKEFTPVKKTQSAVSPAAGTSLSYVVNTVMPNLFQVTTFVGNVRLSRGYVVATDGKAYPAGPWTREE